MSNEELVQQLIIFSKLVITSTLKRAYTDVGELEVKVQELKRKIIERMKPDV